MRTRRKDIGRGMGYPHRTGPAVLVLITLPFLFSSCTGLKYATEEDPLFAGYGIRWTHPPEEKAGEALGELQNVVTPVPNNSLLGMRPTVALHNMVKEPRKPKGLRNLLKYKIGSPPVHLGEVPLDAVRNALVNRMNNRGHFGASATMELLRTGRKAKVVWTVAPGPLHRIRDIRVGDSTATGLDSALAAHRQRLGVATGDPYHLARLTEDRAALAGLLRDRGWYRLRADDLVWTADTTSGSGLVDLHLRVKPSTSPAKRIPYTIGTVTVHGDQDELLPAQDTVVVNDIRYVDYLNMYRPVTILRGVFIRPGDPFSQRRSDATQRYLTSYGVFRNVLISHTDDSLRHGVLNAEVTLVPLRRFSLFSELNAISKSNNFAGPGIKVGFRDRDLFRGAEQFTMDLNGRFETQIAGDARGTNAYEIGIKAGLQVPRMLLLPFLRTARTSVPTTHIDAGYGLFRRIGLYGLESVNASLGYAWREDRRSWHDLKLTEISYNNLYYASDDFRSFLERNPAIQRSFDEQFIIGIGYTYTRSTRRNDGQRNWAVYTLGGDEGGNLLSGIYRGLSGPRPEEGHTLFGERFSQYLRLRPEVRWYRRTGAKDGLIASRLLVHGAFAYGNSTTVPYVKQFFAGGPNGLRGFRARGVGPGSYVSEEIGNLLIDQVGDLKIEANLEYRFTLSGFMKAAIFGDAGNVWLWNEDPQRPGGKFEWDDFLGELAFNGGLGLRIDPEVIVIRLDLAMPLHRPDQPVHDRWVFNDPGFRWNRNLILNIAIGYPF